MSLFDGNECSCPRIDGLSMRSGSETGAPLINNDLRVSMNPSYRLHLSDRPLGLCLKSKQVFGEADSPLPRRATWAGAGGSGSAKQNLILDCKIVSVFEETRNELRCRSCRLFLKYLF